MTVFEFKCKDKETLKNLYKYKNKLKMNQMFLITNVISITPIIDDKFYTLEETGQNILVH